MKKKFVTIFWIIPSIITNWQNNYIYHGGLSSAFRCLFGSITSYFFSAKPVKTNAQVDILTFSIAPSLTLVWLAFMAKIRLQQGTYIFIGDCSGGIRPEKNQLSANVGIHPFSNDAHGQKIDHFIQRYCHAEYVLICDDDVFFLDDAPLLWAVSQMQANPKLVVVSFVPRERFTWEINQQIYTPMGSYCLLIRRALWQKEKLSFETVHQPSLNPKSYNGEYDTADFANVELIRRGYDVLIAPPEIRAHLHICKGISGTLWEAQSSLGEFSRSAEMTYTNLFFLKEISILAERIYAGVAQNSPTWKSIIDAALEALAEKQGADALGQLTLTVRQDVKKLSSILFDEPEK